MHFPLTKTLGEAQMAQFEPEKPLTQLQTATPLFPTQPPPFWHGLLLQGLAMHFPLTTMFGVAQVAQVGREKPLVQVQTAAPVALLQDPPFWQGAVEQGSIMHLPPERIQPLLQHWSIPLSLSMVVRTPWQVFRSSDVGSEPPDIVLQTQDKVVPLKVQPLQDWE